MSVQTTVSFSGYRPEKLSENIDNVKEKLHDAIMECITSGYDTFLCGMAEGFDLIAGDSVLSIKQSHPQIRLIAVLPFDSQWVHSAQYNNVLASADETVILADKYNRGSYFTRNEYMVNHCSRLICYYDGLAGGTEYTVEYAQKKGVSIHNLAPKATTSAGSIEIFNNTTRTVRDDLERIMKKDSKVAIAGAYFSIYAFQELKKRLTKVDKLRFIFTSPTFVTEKIPREKREFYIPRLNREKSLYGTEFEVKLRNQLTQKTIAKECAAWIEKKATFKSNITSENMMGFITVENKEAQSAYMPLNGFTTVDIGCERGNNIYNVVQKTTAPMSKIYFDLFDEIWNDKTKLQDVTKEVIDSITTVYRENSPEFIYFVTLYNIFTEFLEDISEDVLPNEGVGFKNSEIWKKLYNFQKDAALAIINKLEKYNGCILADSVGLGKTFTALAVIKYYENRNRSVLVLCPKKLSDNWNTYKLNLLNNPIAQDRLRYDVLYHTDLSRDKGYSNGVPLDRLNWGAYDLVVIDESHNFRNGGQNYGDGGEKENRYLKLLNKVIRQGIKTKVLMLSATPVNNRFNDLKNQLSLAYEGNAANINGKLNTKKSIDDIFRQAQTAFNIWSNLPINERTTACLLKMLNFDFFEVLDSVTIARSRKHIEKYYNTENIGKFPQRNKPISLRCPLTSLPNAISFNEIYSNLSSLNMAIYNPSEYVLESKRSKYDSEYGTNMGNVFFSQANREEGIMKLMRINLLKRLESSVHSFQLTIGRMVEQIEGILANIAEYEKTGGNPLELTDFAKYADFDDDDRNIEMFSVGKKVKIDLADLDYKTWAQYLHADLLVLQELTNRISQITSQHDTKLQKLFSLIRDKLKHPINPNNKKVLIFSAFSDTAEYLYENVSLMLKKEFGLHTAMVTGGCNKSTLNKRDVAPFDHGDINTILTLFSPRSKEKQLIMPNVAVDIDVLIGTDCISEGQNLQDCDYLINYDIHWNPVRIIQRFGRIDRIGSINGCIQLVNFWPDINLDEYINLKARVETRMKAGVMVSTGTAADNPLEDEKSDLEYRKAQLERLQNEVVDVEDMSTGISIMDLGLNEFRLDLLGYVKDNPHMDKTPFGMHAVTCADAENQPGVVYILKNINRQVDVKNQNQLHPFYMVYITNKGQILANHLEPKKLLDMMRLLCKGKNQPVMELCQAFNEETSDGKNMEPYSKLLENAIASIIAVTEQSDIDSFFGSSETTALKNNISGLDDFELICFLIVR